MNRQIRRSAYVVMALFVALVVNVTVIQAIRADSLNNNPSNSLGIIREFSRQRGPILAADGTTLAQSVATDDVLKYLRQYPQSENAAHLTGFDSFVIGRSLSEQAFNGYLTGHEAPVTLGTIVERLEDDLAGDQVNLTINWQAQLAAADALGGRTGAVFAVDPKTGGVLVSYSAPSYDPSVISSHNAQSIQQNWNELNADPNKPLLARAFRERYPPGSSFKIVTAAAALETGKATLDSTYPSESSVTLPQTNRELSNYDGSSCGGTLVESFARSCNTVFGPLAVDVGAQQMSQTAQAFGFNVEPTFDLPAVESVYPAPTTLSPPLLAFTGIGQESVQATPFEMALVSAAIANAGVIMQPQILGSVTDEKGNVIRRMEPREWRRATSPQVAADIEQMMIAVVESGTGRRAQIDGIQVAGKTGTAQTGEDTADHAWFTAYAPVGDPKVAIAVVLENAGGGGLAAAPVAKTVIEAILE